MKLILIISDETVARFIGIN